LWTNLKEATEKKGKQNEGGEHIGRLPLPMPPGDVKNLRDFIDGSKQEPGKEPKREVGIMTRKGVQKK